MRALLIDPVTKTISEVDFSGQLKGMGGAYELLTSPAKAVDCIDIRNLGSAVAMIFDDEGGLVDGNPVFQIGSMTIAGRALLVADARELNAQTSEDDDWCALPAYMTTESLSAPITFTDKLTTGEFEPGREMTKEELKATGFDFMDHGWKGGDIILRDPA
jgi:hypothetical protein